NDQLANSPQAANNPSTVRFTRPDTKASRLEPDDHGAIFVAIPPHRRIFDVCCRRSGSWKPLFQQVVAFSLPASA
ncbi:MAG: hypothetical protein NT013_07920, partial [Planctomycetia bacterium]|nr:hypothetical protein [Planctomycetia bacterium]